MRDIPSELAARIESGAASLCHAWILERADGLRLGFTDHDRDVEIEGVRCGASSGWTLGAAEAEGGLTPGGATASGAMDDEAITEADIAAGLYDGARLEIWRVDWVRPDLKIRLWTGRISRIVREGSGLAADGMAGFTAELEGPMASLDRVAGRTYGRMCDAILGDARCGADLTGRPDAACDKRWETCTGTFANGARFRGFPDIPGDDFLAAWPAEGERHDGGSRR